MPEDNTAEMSAALESKAIPPESALSRQRSSKQPPATSERQQSTTQPSGRITTTRHGSHLGPNQSRPQHGSSATAAPPPMSPTPERITSMRPPEDPASAPNMTPKDANVLCNQIVTRIYQEDVGNMWEKAGEADRRGNVDDKMYTDLLDFFYCFIPMATKSPPTDPIIFRGSDLQNHRRVLNTFGCGRRIARESGPNDPHQWFSKPGPKSLVEEFLEAM